MIPPQEPNRKDEKPTRSASEERLASRILQRFGMQSAEDEFPDFYRMLDLSIDAREDQIVTAIEVRNGLLDALDPLDPLRRRLTTQLRAAARTLLNREDRAVYDKGVARNHATAMDMRSHLTGHSQPDPTTSKKKRGSTGTPRPSPTRGWILSAVLAGVAVLLLIGGTILFVLSRSNPTPPAQTSSLSSNQPPAGNPNPPGNLPSGTAPTTPPASGTPRATPSTPPAGQVAKELSPAVVKELDSMMENALRDTGSSAGVLALRNGTAPLHLKAYGFMDDQRTRRAIPEAQFSLPALGHPLVVAAVQQVLQARKLSVDARLLPLLKVVPRGPVADPRVQMITVKQFLDHTTGWSQEQVTEARKTAAALNLVPAPPSAEVMLSIMATLPLTKAPGSEVQHSYFFTSVAIQLVERLSGKSFHDYLSTVLLGRKLEGIALPYQPGTAPVVWNSSRGYLCASAPAILDVMHSFGADGLPGSSPGRSLVGTTEYCSCYTGWRTDGIHIVILLNGPHHQLSELAQSLQQTLDRWKASAGSHN